MHRGIHSKGLLAKRLRFAGLICWLLMATPSHAQVRSFGEGEDFSKDFSRHMQFVMTKQDAASWLTTWSTVHADSAWSIDQRLAFQAAARNVLRKRILNAESWQALIDCMRYWADVTGEVTQAQGDRWFAQTVNQSKQLSRKGMEQYLHTATGLTDLTKQGPIRLYDFNGLSWWLIDGEIALADADPEKPDDLLRYQIIHGSLLGLAKGDSTVIDSLYATYDPLTQDLQASSGEVHWLRAGFAPGELYAVLGPWSTNLRRYGFAVDGATLHSSLYVPEPQAGHFEERLTGRTMDDQAVFPRFTCDAMDLSIKDFFDQVDYQGGFSVIGQKFFASGSESQPAHFTFWYDSLKVLDLRSDRFIIRPQGLLSKSAMVSLKLGKEDSLHHLQSTVRFDPSTRLLQINRPDRGLSLTPFSDSYHNLVIDLDQIQWRTNEPQVYLGGLNMGSGSPMVLESREYYRNERFIALQGLDLENPLTKLSEVAASSDNVPMTLYQVAVSMEMSMEHCELLMLELAIQQFVTYDPITSMVEVLNKTHHYVLNRKGKRDYDVIRFVSEVATGMNARINLLDFNMEVMGVRVIALSDSQKVAIIPSSQTILIRKGMAFDFDGRIEAGRFTFYGRQHRFNYELFQFQMPTIDSMRFKVLAFERNANGLRPLVQVKNTIQDISGELWIDDPNNKSSNQYFPQYPIFTAAKSAKIYYDRAYGGIYPKQDFFVNIKPFQIDSLDNTSTEGLAFDGTFVSAGIFPDRPQMIRVQRDYSLGFTESTGDAGWQAFESRGNAAGTVQLTMSGLTLDGDLTYQRALGQSSKFDIFPDSVRGRGVFDLTALPGPERGGGHPSAHGDDASMHWLPYASSWQSQSRSMPFDSYPSRPMKVTGRLTYGDDRLAAKGLLAFNDAELQGRRIRLNASWLQSPYVSFRVRANADSEWGFQMSGTSADVDFISEEGKFVAASGASTLQFPKNQYETSMDRATWHIERQSVAVTKGNGLESRMTSTHPRQEGLSFLAKEAEFFLKPSVLEAHGVPHIDVADSRLFPDSGRVTIEASANMRRLKQAAMTASLIGGYHKFKDLDMKVRGRNELYGSGTYRYVDENFKEWPIHMGKIDVDSNLRVIAQGEITLDDRFQLNPWFKYYGIMRMVSDDPLLDAQGRIHITLTCPSMKTDWIMTHTAIDPMDIVIQLPDPDTTRPAHIVTNGIYLMNDSTTVYTAFARRNNPSVAVELFKADGVLFYSDEESGYVVTTMDRWADESVPDNMLIYQPALCEVRGYGQLSLGENRMGRVAMRTYGSINHRMKTGRLTSRVAITLDFLFADEVLDAMHKELASNATGIPTDLEADGLSEALIRLMNPREINRFLVARITDKQPKQLRQTMVFDDVDFKWNTKTRSFRSVDAIGLGSIDGQGVHRYIDGELELRKRRSGDEISIYLNPATEHFFTYRRNTMRYYASNSEHLTSILNLKPSKRSIPRGEGLPRYSFITTTYGNLLRFLDGLEQGEDDDLVDLEE